MSENRPQPKPGSFLDAIGPFELREEDGRIIGSFVVAPHHLNNRDSVHGGMLMTFADFGLFVLARKALGDGGGVTVSMNADFLAAAKLGDCIEVTGEVINESGRLVFVRGILTSGEQTLLRFSGIIRKMPKAT